MRIILAIVLLFSGRNSGPRDSNISSPSYLSHQTSNLYTDPKLSPVQKRSSASPSPSITSMGRNPSLLADTNSNLVYCNTGVQEITEIPDDYLSQSSVLKHLAKEVKVPSPNGTTKNDNLENLLNKYDPSNIDFNNLPPPPEYPKWSEKSPLQQAVNNRNNKLNSDKLNLSKSQPDLSTVGTSKCDLSGFRRGVSAPRPPTKGREENESKGEEIWPSAEMVEILIKENSALKHELENCYQRVERTQRVRIISSLGVILPLYEISVMLFFCLLVHYLFTL